MKQETLKVEGMTCGGCVNSVTMAAKRVEGVEAVNVSLEKGEASVTYDPSKTDRAKIAHAIEDAGYEVAA